MGIYLHFASVIMPMGHVQSQRIFSTLNSKSVLVLILTQWVGSFTTTAAHALAESPHCPSVICSRQLQGNKTKLVARKQRRICAFVRLAGGACITIHSNISNIYILWVGL